MSFISDFFAGGASKLIDSVGNTLDKITTTKEEKLIQENEMRKTEYNHELDMGKLTVEDRKNLYLDLDSARNREIAVAQSSNATKLTKNAGPILAFAATALCFGMFYALVFTDRFCAKNNPELKDIAIYILGVLSALLSQVYSYYFGSSSGSADKSRTISNAFDKKN